MLKIEVVKKSTKWDKEKSPLILVKNITRKIAELLDLEPKNKGIIIEISVSLLSDLQIKKINKEFRKKDKATNTLSFPAFDIKKNELLNLGVLAKQQRYIFLGDILLSYQAIKTEAESQNKEFLSHLTHLILHSLLHLIGFDHTEDDQAEIMENLEIRILKQLNINNPYQINAQQT